MRAQILSSRSILFLAVILQTACATTAPPPAPVVPPEPVSEVIGIPVVVKPKVSRAIPKQSRIIITDIQGDCATEVKDAIMRRLIDNTDYHVLAREYLEQIQKETRINAEGDFNSLTMTQIGELMGASQFIVGRVIYCGPANKGENKDEEKVNREEQTSPTYSNARRSDGTLHINFGQLFQRHRTNSAARPGNGERAKARSEEPKEEFYISAILQVINLETGSVLISGNPEGRYSEVPKKFLTPNQLASVIQPEADEAESSDANAGTSSPANVVESIPATEKNGPIARAKGVFNKGKSKERNASSLLEKIARSQSLPATTSQNLPVIKAAENLANEFADKLFSRPTWEIFEMWNNPRWLHGASVRYVKLGRCKAAINLLDNLAQNGLREMPEIEIAEYLHNYGVALLCDNQPERAMEKLRSAYRVSYGKETLRMLNLAAKVVEWSLNVEVDTEPETQLLAERHMDPEMLEEIFPDGPFSISESP